MYLRCECCGNKFDKKKMVPHRLEGEGVNHWLCSGCTDSLKDNISIEESNFDDEIQNSNYLYIENGELVSNMPDLGLDMAFRYEEDVKE